jgi:hypothetical protein
MAGGRAMLTRPVPWIAVASVFVGVAGGTHWTVSRHSDLKRTERLHWRNSHAGRANHYEYRKAAPMPPTESAGHRELASAEVWAMDAHRENEKIFLSATGFGYSRAYEALDNSGRFWKSLSIRRAELVSLLQKGPPTAYVLEQMPAAPTSDLALRRPLDAFETEALAALQRGSDAVASTADPVLRGDPRPSGVPRLPPGIQAGRRSGRVHLLP